MRRALLALLVLALLAPAAAAHANIQHSEPASGARLPQAPDHVRLVLTQPVDRDTLVLTVTDQDGRRVDEGPIGHTGHDEPVVQRRLQSGLPDGAYLISLTATSLTDSHRITYTVGFAVGGFVPPASDLGQDEDVDGTSAAGRALAYAGLALVIGGLALGWRLGRPGDFTGPVRLGAALHGAAVLLLLDTARRSAQQDWWGFFGSEVGALLAWRGVAAAALLAAALARGPRWWTAVAAAAAVLTAARFTHTSLLGPLAILNDALHIVAASAWVGGLALLVWAWRDGARDALRDATRFSTLALVAVSLLAATGVMATVMVIDPALWRDPRGLSSDYAWFLGGKVLLAGAMVGVAALNRHVLLHDPVRDGDRQRWLRRLAARARRAWLLPGYHPGARPGQGLRRLVGTEAVLGGVALVLAALLLSSSPPQAGAAQQTGTDGLRLAGSGDDVLVTAFLDPEPVAGGSSDMSFFVQYVPDHRDAPGEPVRNDTCGRSGCIQVRMTGLDGTVDERRVAAAEGGGWWRVDGLVWTRSGAYELTVEVQTEFVFRDAVVLRLDVPAAPPG